MNALADQIEGLKFLKVGWNNDPKHPAPAINKETRENAKALIPYLDKLKVRKWRVAPSEDGSILFIGKNITISIGAL